jgi:threonine dehydrogenase-like Zn-dependent dehydrogenase
MIAVPARNLHEVPASISDEEAVFAEPLAAAIQVLRQVKIGPTDKVVVLGDGRLGQLVARVLKPLVRRPLLVGRHAGKLETAEKAGVQAVAEKDYVPAAQADVVVEATGNPKGLELAMRAVRPRGTIVLKSTVAVPDSLNLAPLVINEITVVGSRCGPMGMALRALARREVDVAALVSRRFPLADGLQALRAAKDPAHIKVLIDVHE